MLLRRSLTGWVCLTCELNILDLLEVTIAVQRAQTSWAQTVSISLPPPPPQPVAWTFPICHRSLAWARYSRRVPVYGTLLFIASSLSPALCVRQRKRKRKEIKEECIAKTRKRQGKTKGKKNTLSGPSGLPPSPGPLLPPSTQCRKGNKVPHLSSPQEGAHHRHLLSARTPLPAHVRRNLDRVGQVGSGRGALRKELVVSARQSFPFLS